MVFPQGSHLTLILCVLYVSDIPQPVDIHINLSEFADNIAIWAQAAGIPRINLRLEKYLN